MIEWLKSFFSRWFLRFKVFVFLFAIWAVIYATNTVIGTSGAFEYDDGFVYSGDLFRKASSSGLLPDSTDYWTFINKNYRQERVKPVPWLVASALKFLGVRVEAIADRKPEGAQALEKKRSGIFSAFNFVSDQNAKYELLEKNKFLFFFSASDEGIIQAKKAGIKAIRVKKNPKSESSLSFNPDKFGEKTLPLSQF